LFFNHHVLSKESQFLFIILIQINFLLISAKKSVLRHSASYRLGQPFCNQSTRFVERKLTPFHNTHSNQFFNDRCEKSSLILFGKLEVRSAILFPGHHVLSKETKFLFIILIKINFSLIGARKSVLRHLAN